MDFPQEIVCEIENKYSILEKLLFCDYNSKFFSILIYDENNEKYDSFIVNNFYENNPENIIKKYPEINLEMAKKIFTNWELNENNYGF